jgi:isoleucyl-tRNA synthetase
LLANTSDFDAATDAVPVEQMLEIDRWALARTAELQADILARYERYEFHTVVNKLQVFCSEDLGSFYLDILKDRLYTSAPGSLARRSAQTALWQITHAMLRWMAPFLSFTAEEAWAVFAAKQTSGSIFTETYWSFDGLPTDNAALLSKWSRVRELREIGNKFIEELRSEGKVGSSLQANLEIDVGPSDHQLLQSLGDGLKFVFITSGAILRQPLSDPDVVSFAVTVSDSPKCERCWHYRDDVGVNPAHPTLCGRCDANLHGSGELRQVA